MPGVVPLDLLREAFVVLDPEAQKEWVDVVVRSGRLKVTKEQLVSRARLSFGWVNADTSSEVRRTILKDVQVANPGPQLDAVLCAGQLEQMFSGEAKLASDRRDVDAAALAVRVLSRGSEAPVSAGIVIVAQDWLLRRGDELRTISYPKIANEKLPRIQPPTVAFDPSSIQTGLNEIATHLNDFAAKIDASIETLAAESARLQMNEFVMGEQQQMSWWLLGAASEGPRGWLWALAEATQLANLTRVVVPPRSARELFKRRAAQIGWDPESELVTPADSAGVEGLRPILDRLRQGEMIAWSSPDEAALALYDELMLSRMLRS